MAEHRCRGCIGADHPSLAGHFPGNPVVPGVVLLDWIQAAAREAWPLPPLSALPKVKFLAPLLPEVEFDLRLSYGDGRLLFKAEAQGQLLAQGTMLFAGSIA